MDAKENVKFAEELELMQEKDIEDENQMKDVIQIALESHQMATLFKELNEARLEGNVGKRKQKMEAFFKAVDHWLEKGRRTKEEELKEGFKKAYANVRESCENVLRAEGVSNFTVQYDDSNNKNFYKTCIRFTNAQTIMMDAANESEQEEGYQVAFKIKNELQGYLRNMEHDEL